VESSTAPQRGVDAATIAEAFRITSSRFADDVAVRTKDDEISWTWSELRERVDALAGGLHELGLGKGETIALMLGNRPEFHLADLAAMMVGATPFSIYMTYAPNQIEYVVSDAGARILITEQQYLANVLEARRTLPDLEHVIVIDGDAPEGTLALADVSARGAESSFDVDASIAAMEPDDVLTLIYTSGTTGPPKGVELAHRNLLSAVAGIEEIVEFPEGARVISWLPNAHIAERAAHHYLPIVFGFQVTTCPNPREIVSFLPSVRPHWFFAVPRIWEKLKAGLEAMVAGQPEEQRAKAQGALAAAVQKVRLEFFHAIGLPLSELWGMSETCGGGAVNPPGKIKIGTVGPATPGCELKLAADGELLIRGGMVMLGYRGLPDKTAETIDADGWLATGDIAQIDEDGYVKIVDRKKEIIINAAGKNMSPANIEATLKSASPLIGNAVCIGDAKPYNTALLVLDADFAPAWAAQQGIEKSLEELASDDALREAVQAAVDAANAKLARVEQIKRFVIVEGDWLPGGDELTPTMKLKRKPIAEKYDSAIGSMYAG
jgi:long-chain acyl-CoA synthetase